MISSGIRRVLGGLGGAGLVLLGLAGLVLALALLYAVVIVVAGPGAALVVYLWEVAPDLLLFPHLLALGIVVLVGTTAVSIRGAVGRGEVGPGGAGSGCLLPIMILPTFLLHLLPALLAVLLVQEVWLALPIDWKDPAEFALVVFLPAAKIGLLFSIAGNFSDLASLAGVPPLRRHLGQFLLALIPLYYASLAAAAGVGLLLGSLLSPPFRPLVPLGRLFAPPRVAPDPAVNAGLLVLLVAGCALVSYLLRRNRAASARTARTA